MIILVSQRAKLLFDGEKCVLLLCAWKPAFLRSGHILLTTDDGDITGADIDTKEWLHLH